MQRTSKDPVIQLKNLVKIYDEVSVLNSISLDVFNGETLALIGTSGSGKTTLLKSINGLVPRSSGDILVYGKHIDDWELTALRRRMGYVIQDVGLFPHYTIEKNIRLVPELLGWEDEQISERLDQLLEKIHIPDGMKNRYPGELSGGQQQRVGLARALAADPDIILMDEPFGALDPIIRSGMQQEFLSMEGLKDKAIILVTHDMSEAAVLADRICLLDHGKVQQTGTLKELLFHPENNFVKNFLDSQRDELELRAIYIRDLESLLPADLLRDVSDCALADVPSKYSAEVRKTYYLRRNEILSKLKID